MTTRQDMFRQNLIEFLQEQETNNLISKSDYQEFYYFLEEWWDTSMKDHPREESTIDCDELTEKGEHTE